VEETGWVMPPARRTGERSSGGEIQRRRTVPTPDVWMVIYIYNFSLLGQVWLTCKQYAPPGMLEANGELAVVLDIEELSRNRYGEGEGRAGKRRRRKLMGWAVAVCMNTVSVLVSAL